MSKYTIGIDLGGTTMTAGLVNENYEIVAKTTWATRLPRPAEDLEKALADLCRTVAKENKVDFTNSRNLIIAAVILVSALGFNSVGGLTFVVAGVSINLSGLAIAAIAGILLNAILPGNDYEFDEGSNEPESASLRV